MCESREEEMNDVAEYQIEYTVYWNCPSCWKEESDVCRYGKDSLNGDEIECRCGHVYKLKLKED